MSCLDVMYHQSYGAHHYLPATSAAAAAAAYKAAYYHHHHQQQQVGALFGLTQATLEKLEKESYASDIFVEKKVELKSI